MRFSQRIGKTPVREALQIGSVDIDLRNTLWNAVYTLYLKRLARFGYVRDVETPHKQFLTCLWRDFYKEPVDTIPPECSTTIFSIKTRFYEAEWYEVYDLIEFVAQYDRSYENKGFETACNDFLEREMSGYRLLDGAAAPITNEVELAEIEAAIQNTQSTILTGANEHLRDALAKLADRKNPDYRNSIKESISAVESISRVISKDPKAKLGDALKAIEEQVGLHPALKRGFSAIYGYTSDEGGIRHALMESPKCDFEDAKYMLVSCSAFINYLIVKAAKAGITLS